MRFVASVLPDYSGKVIYYHDLRADDSNEEGGTKISDFLTHVHAAKDNGFRFVSSLSELDSSKTLLLTFDDGFNGLWRFREVLFDEGLKPTVFIAPLLVGKPGFLTWTEVLDLQRMGFLFQSHSFSHLPLVDSHISRSKDELHHELVDSKTEIENKIGQPVTQICFPRGHFSERVIDACYRSGYKDLFSSLPGSIYSSPSFRVVARNRAERAMRGEFLAIIKGGVIPFREHYVKKQYFPEEACK